MSAAGFPHLNMKIEGNVAKQERDHDGYHVVLTIEHRNSESITQIEAARVLSKVLPLMYSQTSTFGSQRCAREKALSNAEGRGVQN